MNTDGILIAKGQTPLALLFSLANRHGLIAGATGTGKSVTLRVMAEGFSRAGVPVFLADVKGDLAGMCVAGTANPKLEARAAELGIGDFAYHPQPVVFWDVFGQQGHPLRATISDMGPLLLARLLGLNETQSGVLNLAFKLADDEGLLLLDLKDLRAMLGFISERAKELTTTYGNVSAASIGAIQRALLVLEEQGGDQFFGEPALELGDLMRTDPGGRGIVNIIAADKLMQSPKLYATFLLFLLGELFEELPEVGDLDKPKLVFFFDEAHLLFDEAPKALVDKVEQVVRLIRSKGIGVYFITQNPLDLPDAVLGQLGNRVQHALRAFTPRDQKAVKAAAETFRAAPGLDVTTAIMELGVGEALVSLLDPKGTPQPVQRALIRPPESRLGAISPEERAAVVGASAFGSRYAAAIDRESAYERLRDRTAQRQPAQGTAPQTAGTAGPVPSSPWGGRGSPPRDPVPRSEEPARSHAPARSREGIAEAMMKSAARSIGSQLGRQILRGVLGSMLGGGSTRRRR